MHDEPTRFEPGCGNVFADLGLPDPGDAIAKAEIAQEFAESIERRGLGNDEAARMTGLGQSQLSAIIRGRLRGFTQSQLTQCVEALGGSNLHKPMSS